MAAINGDGTPSAATSIVTFLNSATAQDSVDNSVIVYNDAPEMFPVGSTQVTFSATDSSGNKALPVTAIVLIESFYVDISANDTVFRFLGRWNFDSPEIPRIGDH
ncbi:MAG: HYR domain-containing protein [Dehalococcoidia bacterium]|nr:HYR domain-containing protein [Dehalococcoidia bacterium]HIG67214.1 HYR domain-containing protein [Porticoccaceae bacterium]